MSAYHIPLFLFSFFQPIDRRLYRDASIHDPHVFLQVALARLGFLGIDSTNFAVTIHAYFVNLRHTMYYDNIEKNFNYCKHSCVCTGHLSAVSTCDLQLHVLFHNLETCARCADHSAKVGRQQQHLSKQLRLHLYLLKILTVVCWPQLRHVSGHATRCYVR